MKDFESIHEMSGAEASAVLNRFLSIESGVIGETLARATSEGVHLAFGVKYIKPMLMWILPQLKSHPVSPDPEVPHWIGATESYRKNLFKFEDPSEILLLRAGYFMGESFIKDYPGLCWGTGRRGLADANMPVIKGFRRKLEMPPTTIVENLIRRMYKKDAGSETIDMAVETWISYTKEKVLDC